MEMTRLKIFDFIEAYLSALKVLFLLQPREVKRTLIGEEGVEVVPLYLTRYNKASNANTN